MPKYRDKNQATEHFNQWVLPKKPRAAGAAAAFLDNETYNRNQFIPNQFFAALQAMGTASDNFQIQKPIIEPIPQRNHIQKTPDYSPENE